MHSRKLGPRKLDSSNLLNVSAKCRISPSFARSMGSGLAAPLFRPSRIVGTYGRLNPTIAIRNKILDHINCVIGITR